MNKFKKTITDPSNCLKILNNDDISFCLIKIINNNNSSYRYFASDTKYNKNQAVLDKYITEINSSSLFNSY